MADETNPGAGSIGWVDLTVPDADDLLEFYRGVVGFAATSLDMGGYADYLLSPAGADAPVAGLCHARGGNADVPPVWLVYFRVADLDASLARLAELGGSVIGEPRSAGGYGRFAVIRDPAGAVSAIIEPPK